MPPEQMCSARNADARADIWALGVILYQSLVGRVPFRGDSMPELCVAVLKDVPPLPSSQRPDVPPALDAVIQRCLEKEREARFQSVAELAVALEPFGPPTAPLAVGRICRLQGVPLPPSAEAALQSGEYRALPSSPGAPPGAAPGPDTGALPPGYPVPGLLPRRGETSPVLPDAATQLWPGHAAPAAARPAAPGQIPEPFGSQPGLAPVPLPSQPGLGVRVGTAPPWGNTKPPTEPRSRWAVVAVSSATALVLLAGGATVLLRGQQGGKPAAAPVAGTTEPAAATTDMPAGAETARLAAGSGGSASGKQDDRGSASDQPDAGMAGPAAEGSSTPMRPPSVPAHPGPRRSSQPSPPPVPTPTGPGDDNNPFSGRH
jgi:serine/threonine-protein kinase